MIPDWFLEFLAWAIVYALILVTVTVVSNVKRTLAMDRNIRRLAPKELGKESDVKLFGRN